jgi:propanol-preferring alcohol dehydrogenase
VKPTEPVGIFGIGGLGHLAVQYARIMGGTVVAIDIAQSKLDLAAELGAEHLVDAGTVDPVVALQALGGLDVAVVLAASPGSSSRHSRRFAAAAASSAWRCPRAAGP